MLQAEIIEGKKKEKYFGSKYKLEFEYYKALVADNKRRICRDYSWERYEEFVNAVQTYLVLFEQCFNRSHQNIVIEQVCFKKKKALKRIEKLVIELKIVEVR